MEAIFTLVDGAHTVTALATDESGNTVTASADFILDARTVSIAEPLDGETLDGTEAPGGVVTFSGTTEAGGTVVVNVDGTDYGALLTGTSWTVDVLLADGGHAVTVTVGDGVGNVATDAITFILDARTSVVIGAPVDASTLNAVTAPGGNVTFSGTNEAGATVSLSVDGGAAVAATVTGANWTVTVNGLSETAHSAVATATDLVGNTATDGVSFTVDVTTSVALTVPAGGSTLNAVTAPSGNVAFSGTNEAGATVTISVDGGAAVPATVTGTTWTATVNGLAEGAHTVTATATDTAGNSATTALTTFSIDTIAPAVAVTAPAAGSTLNAVAAPGGNVAFSGTNEAGATVSISVDGGAAVPATVTGTTWAVTVNGLGEGAHTVTATAADAAGNSATTVVTGFSIDTIAPAVFVTAPAGGSTLDAVAAPGGNVAFSGTNEAGATVSISVDGGAAVPATVTGTTWTVTVNGLAEGAHTVTATATDTAGNSATTALTNFTIDTIAPAVAVTAPAGGSTLDAVTARRAGTWPSAGRTRPARR